MSLTSVGAVLDELRVCGCDPEECTMCDVPAKVRSRLAEIEREVEHGYIRLPVDAEGEVIHVGDELENGEYRHEVTDIVWDGRSWHVYHGLVAIAPCDYAHVKPDPLKELLERFWRETDGIAFPGDKDGLLERKKDEYAERIRGLFGEGS